MKRILLISTCQYSLHELEFVNPVENTINNNNLQSSIIHISNINQIKKPNEFSHIIICGTAIKDFSYNLYDISSFLKQVEELEIPILGICAGAQIISNYKQIPLVYNFKSDVLKFRVVNTSKIFNLIENDIISGYALHSYCVNQNDIENKSNINSIIPILESVTGNKVVELFKINDFYLSFFHIEIKNKNLLENWIHNSKKIN